MALTKRKGSAAKKPDAPRGNVDGTELPTAIVRCDNVLCARSGMEVETPVAIRLAPFVTGHMRDLTCSVCGSSLFTVGGSGSRR